MLIIPYKLSCNCSQTLITGEFTAVHRLEVRENGQNFKTSSSNSPPFSNAPPYGRLERQIPYSWRRLEVKFPGYARGGGMLKFRIDRYISTLLIATSLLKPKHEHYLKVLLNLSKSQITSTIEFILQAGSCQMSIRDHIIKKALRAIYN
jgi:hypothetical protein